MKGQKNCVILFRDEAILMNLSSVTIHIAYLALYDTLYLKFLETYEFKM